MPIYPRAETNFEANSGPKFRETIVEELDGMLNALTALKAKVDETIKTKTEQVESNWGTERERLVPGELALDLVMQKFGLRFHKDHDGPRLAGLMRDEEIDPGLKALIVDLGTL